MKLDTHALDGDRDGFRLERLEVYNWGTFDRRVWTLTPHGSAALLTGANGSGKSTLVDALLTLLVPQARRSYNLASGSERRRERDERTYVRGAYGRVRDDESNAGAIRYLRGKDSYSVLAAVFAHPRTRQCVTLAQVFWTQDDAIRKFYAVATDELGIARDLATGGDMAALRRQLKTRGVEVYDEFVQYSRRFCKLFGLRSEKALDLFNQVVSIKEIGGLNEFVRAHMLERTDAQEKIAQLRAHYDNLTRAHDAIARAERQLALLQPLLDEAAQHDQLQARVAETERCAAAVPAAFARRKLELLDRAIAEAGEQAAEHERAAATLARQLEGLRREQIDLNVAISRDGAGQRLQQLAQEIEHVAERRRDRRQRAEKYDALAAELGLPAASDAPAFAAAARAAAAELPPLEARLGELVAERDARKQEAMRLEEACRQLRAELESLRQRKSQIPAEDLRLRAQLAAALAIPEGELPFVGELLKVRDDARPWEAAIERLLHGYGRQLLVPEAHHRRVVAYVDATDLRGRLVFHRVTGRSAPVETGHLDPAALLFKLEVKPGAALHEWLRADLAEHYDYVCCESLDQFARERRALTRNGQVKSGGTRHEKDDRHPLGDRKRYVLGWDNRDKVAALEAELLGQAEALRAAGAAIGRIEAEQARVAARQGRLRELLHFDDFAALDWGADERLLAELEARRRELEAGSDALKLLREQLAAAEARIAAAEDERARAQAARATLEGDLRRFRRQREACAERAGTAIDEASAARIAADLDAKRPTLDTVDELQAQAERQYAQSAAALKGRLSPIREGIVVRMTDFKHDYPTETEDVDASIEAVGEFRRMLERIQREDLPRHARRFKELLDEKVIANIAIFKGALEKLVDEIKASIANLNGSLFGIDYTPSTYIQLCHQPSRDREIVEFRNALRACLPDVGQPRTAEANEASFQRIKALIQRFQEEERWTAKVTDVRNWLDFSAEERYQEDDSVKNYYSDSSGKSGGQKAKLAYTILASAIAYQYGLDQDEARGQSFRFVVVDEAFSRSDETNARYAMELFKRLHLQLLVVTPLDKTHIVEPYISACHFVANTRDENDSKVYNLTVEEYREQKAAFADGRMEMARA